MPEVSIVMPVYNGEPFLADTLASVRRQTFADWELLVSDDGSTDGTVACAERLGDARIRVLPCAVNAGYPTPALNRGIVASRGRYIAILAADDLWTRESLAVRLGAFRPSDLLVCGQVYDMCEGMTLEMLDTLPALKNTGGMRYFYGPSNLLRRETFERFGLFDERLRVKEDREMWVRLFGEDRARTDRGTFTCVPDVVGFFRVRAGSYGATYRHRDQDWRRDQVRVFRDAVTRRAASCADLPCAPALGGA